MSYPHRDEEPAVFLRTGGRNLMERLYTDALREEARKFLLDNEFDGNPSNNLLTVIAKAIEHGRKTPRLPSELEHEPVEDPLHPLRERFRLVSEQIVREPKKGKN